MKQSIFSLTLALFCLGSPTAWAQQSQNPLSTDGSFHIGVINWRGMATGFRGGIAYEPFVLQRDSAKTLSKTKLGFYVDVLGVEGSHLFEPRASPRLISSIFGIGGGFQLTHSHGHLFTTLGLGHYSLTHGLTHHQYQNQLVHSRRSGWGTRYAIGTVIGKDRQDCLQLSITQLPRLQDERRGNNLILGLDFIYKPR